jgi:hypothetical protein
MPRLQRCHTPGRPLLQLQVVVICGRNRKLLHKLQSKQFPGGLKVLPQVGAGCGGGGWAGGGGVIKVLPQVGCGMRCRCHERCRCWCGAA